MKTNQPQLYIVIDHNVDFLDTQLCVSKLKNTSIKEEFEQYLLYVSHLSNKEIDTPQDIRLEKIDDDNAIWLTLNDIQIKIHKHIVQVRFPVIFRAFFDYDFLREAICNLIKKLFTAYGSTQMSVYPSYWSYADYEIKNDWHKRRLTVLQDKICDKCSSYKRTKLNLRLCLSDEIYEVKDMRNKQYKAWFVKNI